MREFVTACPRNCYSTCSFKVQVENNAVKRILPYEGNLATPEGPCVKGLSYIERSRSSQRLLHPLLRKPDGTFQQITITEALEIAAGRLDEIRNRYGPQSVLWYKGSGMSGLTNEIGHSFWKSFGGVTLTYGNLCWPAGLEAVRLTLGDVKHNVPWDLENARLILVWGKNTAETNIQEMAFIGKAKALGARIVAIDIRRTSTADKADILYRPNPGTDAALALALASVIIREDLYDKAFVNEHVKGFEEFSRSLTISPSEAEKITGIPACDITELARMIAIVKPVTILPGYGLQRHYNGGQTIRAILALSALTGNIGRKGAGFNYANLQSCIYDHPKEPLSYYPDPEKDKPFRRCVSMAKLGVDIMNARDPEIKSVWIERGNPVLQAPDSGNVVKALSKLEFRVVSDQFMTDTAAMADLIFPAKVMFEQSDIICSYWSPYVQFKPKILDPPGEVIPETEIYYHLARVLKTGADEYSIPQPGNDKIEKWLADRISGDSTIKLDDLRQGPVIPPGLREIAYHDLKFDTPSGRIELFSQQASDLWNISPLPGFRAKNGPDTGAAFPLVMVTPNLGNRIHSQFGNLDIIKEISEKPAVEISHEDAEKRGIGEGDMIRVYNERGEFSCGARVTGRVPAGSVVIPNGIWLSEGGGSNNLVPPFETDIGYGAAFHDTMVEIERIN